MLSYLAGVFPCGHKQKGTVAVEITQELIQEKAMRIYLAGLSKGKKKGEYSTTVIEEERQKKMRMYLAGTATRPFAVEETMKVLLAESGTVLKTYIEPAEMLSQRIAILESFYYIKDWMIPYIKNYWEFMLDSGAFTFIYAGKKTNGNNSMDFDRYTDRYIEFIKRVDIDLFFEVDVDAVTGLKKVEQFRHRIESQTGKQSIPVWHLARGKEYFIQMCKDYPYVALGCSGKDESAWTRRKATQGYLKWFIDTAHHYGAKIHGLGYTNLGHLARFKFDSTDSTAWVHGNIAGFAWKFTGTTVKKILTGSEQRMNSRKIAINNFREWVKFQRYAAVHL